MPDPSVPVTPVLVPREYNEPLDRAVSQLSESSRFLAIASDEQLSDKEKAAEIVRQFESLNAEDQRRALLELSGLSKADEKSAVLVRSPDGKLSMQKVSPEVAERVHSMGRQGFQTATFTNRRQRRAAKAAARHTPAKRSP